MFSLFRVHLTLKEEIEAKRATNQQKKIQLIKTQKKANLKPNQKWLMGMLPQLKKKRTI